MSIYTKKGDKGETSLYGGTRLQKDSLRVSCYGTVDEANSILGVIYASLRFDELKDIVRTIQKNMFIVGAQLASDEKGQELLKTKITKENINELEKTIDFYTNEYGSFSGFVIPGETMTSSLFHVARTVVRRAERLVVSLTEEEFVCPLVLKYLNRLSDTLFILARAEVYKSFIQKVADKVNFIMREGFDMSILTYDLIDKMEKAVRAESERLNVPVCFAVSDENGNILYFRRFEGCILPSIAIAQNKAYTAAVMRMSTKELAELTVPTGPLFGLNVGDPKLVIFGGGQLLEKDGKIVGAIGVSGGSVEEDIQIGNKAVEVFTV